MNYCIDCHKKIDKRSMRCIICSNKGKNNPMYGIKGRKHPNYGKFLTENIKQKIRTSKYHSNLKGKYNPNYKDGRTSLYNSIRHLEEYKKWRLSIFIRDNYTCQECNSQPGFIHSHHIKPLSKLLKEFLKEYDQFSIIEDKETLVRLAIKWKPFWDINNGMTLCYNCHEYKHPSMNFGGK